MLFQRNLKLSKCFRSSEQLINKRMQRSALPSSCATVSPNEWLLCWAPVPTWPELCHLTDNGQGKTPDTVQSTLDHLCAKGLVCGLSRTKV